MNFSGPVQPVDPSRYEHPVQPTVNFFSPPLASSQPLALPLATQSTLIKCLTSGCNSACIRKGCIHQRCKHHCKDKGGCLSHGNLNTAPTPPPSSTADPSLQNTIPLAETQSLTPLAIATQAPHWAEPIHASHILPVFTEQWATEHSLREEQRKKDAEKLANLQKSKHTVFVYAWIQVSFFNSHIFCHS